MYSVHYRTVTTQNKKRGQILEYSIIITLKHTTPFKTAKERQKAKKAKKVQTHSPLAMMSNSRNVINNRELRWISDKGEKMVLVVDLCR
jgi:hypothetical protein